tara:strand:- start:2106 stop:2435 length:330 start_codon:yes stop_codon:yes gene_type:complete
LAEVTGKFLICSKAYFLCIHVLASIQTGADRFFPLLAWHRWLNANHSSLLRISILTGVWRKKIYKRFDKRGARIKPGAQCENLHRLIRLYQQEPDTLNFHRGKWHSPLK